MFEQLDEVSARFQAINDQLMRPDLTPKDLMELNKERSQIEPIVDKYTILKSSTQERADNEILLEDDDEEMLTPSQVAEKIAAMNAAANASKKRKTGKGLRGSKALGGAGAM